jgi:hypothetical protein
LDGKYIRFLIFALFRKFESLYENMSPTVFRYKGYRFFFFSREELRLHIHVYSSAGEAKFWMEPEIKLAHNAGLNDSEIKDILRIINERQEEIKDAWNKHFAGGNN